jgi:hypothetical protein
MLQEGSLALRDMMKTYFFIMSLKAEDPSKEFQNSRSCSMGVNVVTDLSKVLPTFYKHVIVVDLDNSS